MMRRLRLGALLLWAAATPGLTSCGDDDFGIERAAHDAASEASVPAAPDLATADTSTSPPPDQAVSVPPDLAVADGGGDLTVVDAATGG
jgi:hypothetical protein